MSIKIVTENDKSSISNKNIRQCPNIITTDTESNRQRRSSSRSPRNNTALARLLSSYIRAQNKSE
jgi:hypothetical protein